MLLKPTNAMYMVVEQISLTLFEMNCWFPCDQGHVINRPPTMQISLLEWTDSQIRRPAIRKSENYKYVANNQTFKKELKLWFVHLKKLILNFLSFSF